MIKNIGHLKDERDVDRWLCDDRWVVCAWEFNMEAWGSVERLVQSGLLLKSLWICIFFGRGMHHFIIAVFELLCYVDKCEILTLISICSLLIISSSSIVQNSFNYN